MPAKKRRPLWRCPKCGAKFVTRNLWHSCGKFTLEALFAKSEPRVLPLFRKYAALVRKLGRGVEMVPQQTRVVFVDRVRFAGATPRKDGFVTHFILGRPVVHARIVKHEFHPPHYHLSYVRVRSEADLDATLHGWLQASHDYYGRDGLARGR
jgi:hypothetical protein